MPEDSRIDDVEKLLSDEKSLETRKQALIADLLKRKEAAIKDFDEKKQAAMKDFDDKLAALLMPAKRTASAVLDSNSVRATETRELQKFRPGR